MRLRLLLLIVPVFIFGIVQSIFSQNFTRVEAGFPITHDPADAWVDVDNDGDLDAFLSGQDEMGIPHAGIYLNNGGSFTLSSANISGVYFASCSFGDYNNDGLADLAVCGMGTSGASSKIYRNDGGGAFTDIGAGITGLSGGGIAWGDYNNDGWTDLLISGLNSSGEPVSLLYNNDEGNSFAASGISLTGLSEGSVAWSDIDLDDDLDLVLVGMNNSQQPTTLIYLNDDGSFNLMGTGLTGLKGASAAWGDYNNDTYPDLLLTGAALNDVAVTIVYKNNSGNSFTSLAGPFPGVVYGSGIWGDFNSDGDLDFLIAGEQLMNGGGGGPPMPDRPAEIKLFINQGNDQFLMHKLTQNGVENTAIVCGDYDNDTDLDLLVSGEMINAIGVITVNAFIFRNETTNTNNPPTAPDGLSYDLIGDDIQFQWNASTDDKTPAEGLNYNMRVGSQDINMDRFSALADLNNGYRRIVSSGNAGANTSWSLADVGFGQFYISVQAIDHNFAGSEFSASLLLEIIPTANFSADDTVCEMEYSDIVYTGNATPDAQYNWDFDGAVVVSGSQQGPYVVYWETQGTKTISLTVSENAVISEAYTHDILVIGYPATPGFVAGPTNVCQGTISSDFAVPPIANAVIYDWSLNPPDAGSISGSGFIGTVVWDPAFDGNAYVSVRGMNYCGYGPYSDSLMVFVSPLPGQPSQPVGPSALCLNNPNTSYTTTAVSNGESYQWYLIPESSGVIFNGGLTAEVDWTNNYSGDVKLYVRSSNGCGLGPASDTLYISMSIPPEANAGDDQLIPFGSATQLSGSASGGSGSYSYYWMPDSLLINPNVADPTTIALEESAQFTFIATDIASGCSGYDQMVVTVTGGPLMVDALADPEEVCAGDEVKLLALAGGGTGNYAFAWSAVPEGFSSTEADPVAYPEVNTMYIVEVTDGGDVVSDSVEVRVSPMPPPAGPINGPGQACAGSEGVLYSISPVQYATHYLWELDEGIFGNSDSTDILLGFASQWTVNQGTIIVTPVNACGYGEPSQLQISIWDIPERPEAISGPDTLCTTTDTTSTYEVSTPVQDASAYSWELQPAEAGYIVGDGLTATAHWALNWEGEAIIAVRAVNECGESEWSDPLAINLFQCLGIHGPGESAFSVRIYPNPSNEMINVECIVLEEQTPLTLDILDLFGRRVLQTSHSGKGILEVNTSSLPPGIYIITLRDPKGFSMSQRIIVQH